MNTLSSERINQTSPYKVISAGEGVVRFITDKALVYEAGFIEDYSLASVTPDGDAERDVNTFPNGIYGHLRINLR